MSSAGRPSGGRRVRFRRMFEHEAKQSLVVFYGGTVTPERLDQRSGRDAQGEIYTGSVNARGGVFT